MPPLPTLEDFRRTFGKTRAGRAVLAARLERARAHRRSLESTRFVCVTGSSGKTTTKELIAAVLATRLRGTKSPGTQNTIETAARTILRTQPGDDFAVVETDAWSPGSIAESAALVRPDIAVVATVGREHQKEFGSVEAAAAEARLLVEAAGAAILNADDPLVLAMREAARGAVVTIGEAPASTLRASEVAATWPDRLSFTLSYDGQSLPISTKLCGVHWTQSVLAALAVGVQLEIPLESAVRAIEAFEPIDGRLSPAVCDGVTFIRDDWKAPQWSVGLALDFIAAARAKRKVIVIGWISNRSGPLESVYAGIAEQALAAADEVVLVGGLAAAAGVEAADGRLRCFPTVRAAARYFDSSLRAGDLVLLKGVDDHLQRIILARRTTVRCWRERCGRRVFCDACYLRRLPARPGAPRRGDPLPDVARP
jgi:UDP-N-acetylmuramoyl-tripeptide--D-alanyl-D-alanine ligase